MQGPRSNSSLQNKKYKLYGMVNHVGSLRGGHYTATILSNEDKTWYEFSDTRVNKVIIHLIHVARVQNLRKCYVEWIFL